MTTADWIALVAVLLTFAGLVVGGGWALRSWIVGMLARVHLRVDAVSDRVGHCENEAGVLDERVRGSEQRATERHNEILRNLDAIEGRKTWSSQQHGSSR